MEKYIVYLYTSDSAITKGLDEIKVEGEPKTDGEGDLIFGNRNFVFNRGSWKYYKKVNE